MRKGSERGMCPLHRDEEDALLILLKLSETRKWREQFLIENGLFLMKR
jgi:hypothetical protein